MTTAIRAVLCLAAVAAVISGVNAKDAPSVGRSGDVVYVALTDAKGAKLSADLASGSDLKLWRHFGDRISPTPAWLDWNNSRVVCGGYGDRGLEPGRYSLSCRAGSYGVFAASFTLERGKAPALNHKFDVWRRVITLRYVDEAGKIHAALPSPPSYLFPTLADKVPAVAGEELGAVLRDRLVFDANGGRGGFDYRRAEGKYLTDAGKWHFVVTAGREGSIRGPGAMKSTFDGPEYDKPFDVKYQANAEWLERAAKLKSLNDNDPGNRSLAARAGPVTRVKFEVSHDLLVPELSDDHRVARTSTGWEAVIPRAAKVQYRLHGGGLFMTDWQALPAVDKSGEIKVRPFVAAGRIEIELTRSTPAAWWEECYVRGEGFDTFELQPAARPGRRVFATLVDESRLKQFQDDGELRVVVAGARDASAYSVLGDDWLSRTAYETLVVLTSEQVAQLARKQTLGITIDPELLAFRAVTAGGAGVPRAQASVFALEDEKLALRLKDIETALQTKGERPSEVQMSKAVQEYRQAGNPDTISEEQLREWLGEKLYDTLGERDLRLRYAQFGAWYDTSNNVTTDPHGFGVRGTGRMKEGDKYVLYLWGGSRDDLKPDLRVEFTYSGGGVDLGALVVPGHS